MRKKGSMTVEAAFVIPLSFFAVMLFLNLFVFLQVQVRVQKEITEICTELMSVGTLMSEAKTVADSSEAAEGGTILSELGLLSLLRQTGTEELLASQMRGRVGTEQWLSHIKNGAQGFSFVGSQVYENGMEIRILVKYSFSFANPVLSVGTVPVVQQVIARGFSGSARKKTERTSSEQQEDDDTKVYVTETGSVFHRSRECSYLKLSIQMITLDAVEAERNSSGGKYYPCELCGGADDGNRCYITDYGVRYHASLSCPGLLRTISVITEEEAVSRGLRPCSKCGAE